MASEWTRRDSSLVQRQTLLQHSTAQHRTGDVRGAARRGRWPSSGDALLLSSPLRHSANSLNYSAPNSNQCAVHCTALHCSVAVALCNL